MNEPAQWQRLQELFVQAVELPLPQRSAFLDDLARTDPTLHRELQRLLSAHDLAGDFLEALDTRRGAALLQDQSLDDADIPDTIANYKMVRRIGGGGMGVVYLAYDAQLDRPVALKLLQPQRALSAQLRQLFIAEAKAASALDHPNIAPVHEIGETEDGRLFIAMTYCEGESLAERITRGPLPPRKAAALARQVADALAAAHRRGIVHRDIKPANVIVSADGWARLVDFGIALVAGTNSPRALASAGTRAYMSPEQLAGSALDRRTDLWSLGVLLYETLTGTLPFCTVTSGDDSGAETTVQLPAHVPPALANIVMQCLARDPADRFAGAPAVVSALDAFLAAPKRRVQRQRVIVASGVALTVLGIAVAVWRQSAANRNVVQAAPDMLAILPFTPVTPDSALERVGRELIVTLSSSLDGAGNIRTVEPVAVLGQSGASRVTSLEDAARVARALGAAQVLSGQLTVSGTGVRLDAAVHSTNDLSVLARATAQAASGDLSTLSAGLAAELLRSGWSGSGSVPSPSALTTRSLPALRAYLDGEMHIAAGRFRAAAGSFERAFRVDSTFWFAYWRYMYALSYHGQAIDSAVVQRVLAHRSEFPESDRLLIEARLENSAPQRVAALRAITERFPSYWPAWFQLGDMFTHSGAFLGHNVEDALAALQRTTELNPNFVPGWEHYFWMALSARDTTRTRTILARLSTFPLDAQSERPDLATLTYYRYLDHLARSGDQPLVAEAEVGVRVLSAYTGSQPPERMAANFTLHGFHRAQLDLARRITSSNARPAIVAAHTWGLALAHAGLGQWDSAFAASSRYARTSLHPSGPLWAYGLAVVGAWLGQIDADSLATARALALSSAQGSAEIGQAEAAWLAGLVACTHNDRAQLQAQRARLAASNGPHAPLLAQSLAAFERAAQGQHAAAARSLAALEWQIAERARYFEFGTQHPYLSAVNRLAAFQWLLQAGDTAQALRLLHLQETNLPQTLHPLQAVNVVLASAALPALHRIETARGLTARARQLQARLVSVAMPRADTVRQRGLCAWQM